MEDRLSQYLREEAARRWKFGTADCVCFAADWVRLARGIDPIAHCRGYEGEAGANALLAGWGSLPRLAGRTLRRAGLPLTRAPRSGDVAVVKLGELATCAIRSRRGWVLRTEKGLASLPPERVRVLAAWSV